MNTEMSAATATPAAVAAPRTRLHPLLAGAAVSVMLVSLAGVAAITGVLPSSHGTEADRTAAASTVPSASTTAATAMPAAATVEASAAPAPAPVRHHVVRHYGPTTAGPVAYAQAAPAAAVQPAAPAPTQTRVAQVNPVGIGVGAVVGGLLGNQIGGGSGRTLATIAGAVGGGYVGNQIANHY